MIRYKDKIFPDYFIDPVTAVITNSKGEIQETHILDGRPYFKSMAIHKIQVHTHIGYKFGMDIHHIDKNKLNNSLSNLVYLTRSEHMKIHSETRVFSEDIKEKIRKTLKGRSLNESTKRKLSKAMKGKRIGEKHPMFGKKRKWINNGVENRFIHFDEDIPEGFIKGRLKK